MSLLHAIYLITGGLVCTLLETLALSSGREGHARAAAVSSTLFVLFALIWFGGYFIFSPPNLVLIIATAIVLGLAVLFFIPTGSSQPIKTGTNGERVDERDVVFSREEYTPGTDRYNSYYAAHPQYRDVDDRMRKLPELLEPGGKYYDPEQSTRIDAVFNQIRKLITRVDGPASPDKVKVDAAKMTASIKRKILETGADDVGIANLNPDHVYSHVGRGPETWGEPTVNNHRFAIVFTIEMAYEAVDAAPGLPITTETANRYHQAAQISIAVADHVRSLGYPARAHISGSNYQIMLPPVAHDAGLGELGRIGYLISPKLGARLRLGAVTTDIPLVADKPISFGVQDFCTKCLKCAANCPSGAIPDGNKTMVRGVHKWKLNEEQCLHYWRAIGTDCGLCMKVCPYSHPPTFVHNLVRAGIRRSSFARTVSVWGDDLFYGTKARFD